MRRLIFLVISTGFLLTLSGCVYINAEMPGSVQSETRYNLSSEDFKVIDRVSVTGETTLWFGMVMVGGKGYQALLAEAQKLGGDAIMNYSFDMQKTSVFMWIYTRVRWKATGLAIKLDEKVRQ